MIPMHSHRRARCLENDCELWASAQFIRDAKAFAQRASWIVDPRLQYAVGSMSTKVIRMKMCGMANVESEYRFVCFPHRNDTFVARSSGENDQLNWKQFIVAMGSAERNWKLASPEKDADRLEINDEFMEISIAARLNHLGRFRDSLYPFARFLDPIPLPKNILLGNRRLFRLVAIL